jgi:hypothetical protein
MHVQSCSGSTHQNQCGRPLDCGSNDPPFHWNEIRHFEIRCELDAVFFPLYLPCKADCGWRQAEGETAEQSAALKYHFPQPVMPRLISSISSPSSGRRTSRPTAATAPKSAFLRSTTPCSPPNAAGSLTKRCRILRQRVVDPHNSKVTIQNFKRFREPTGFILKPEEVIFPAAGNNSGKSTLLQILVVWEFARSVIEVNKGKATVDAVPLMAYLAPFAGSVAGKRILDDIGMEANIGGQEPCQRGWQIHKPAFRGVFKHPDRPHHPQPACLCDTPCTTVIGYQKCWWVFVREQYRLSLPPHRGDSRRDQRPRTVLEPRPMEAEKQSRCGQVEGCSCAVSLG